LSCRFETSLGGGQAACLAAPFVQAPLAGQKEPEQGSICLMPALIRDADDGRSQWSWLVEASVAHHSEKPSVFGEIIEIYFPTLSQVDLHARGVSPRPGWNVSDPEAPTSARGPHASTTAASARMKPSAPIALHGSPCRALGQRRGVGVIGHIPAER